MGQTYPTLTEELRAWIAAQRMFFVATAPMAADGRVNCSPKGLDSFLVLDELTVAYVDLRGSTAETMAHLKENGRIVVMFCAFEGAPKVLRLHGRGVVLEPPDPEYSALLPKFGDPPRARAIIRIELSRIRDACGHGVPLYDFKADRHHFNP